MSQSQSADSTLESDPLLYKKIAWRIIPFLVICIIVSFLDRVNIGYAKLQMTGDLGISDATYGLAAGMFFVGYVLFELPSNLLLVRYGARKMFVRIMFAWGIVSMAMMLVTQSPHLYILRVLLGIAEAGFYPGLMLYLTYWFPREKYAGSVAWFTAGSAASGLLGGPLSGWIMSGMNGYLGFPGWRWLFFLEGLPAVLLAFIAYFYICDKPDQCKWLTKSEKAQLSRDLTASYGMSGARSEALTEAVRNPVLYLLALVYFTMNCAAYGVVLWLPSLVAASGVKSVLHVGLLSALPYCVGIVGIILLSRRSDATGDRRWHFLGCAVVGAISLLALTASISSGNIVFTMLWLCVAVVTTLSMLPIFWATPPMFFGGTAAAGGLALISSIGQIAGFVSPYVVGLAKVHTANFSAGLILMALVLLASGGIMAFLLPWARDNRVLRQAS